MNSFEPMTAGRGFIALAALIFGSWRPFGALVACLLFGFSSALATSLQEYSLSVSTLFEALPYVTLVAVAGNRARFHRLLLVVRTSSSSGVGSRGSGAAWGSVLGALASVDAPSRSTSPAAGSCTQASRSRLQPCSASSHSCWRAAAHTGVLSLPDARAPGLARVGRVLGIVGLCMAAAAVVSLVVYGLLEYVGSRD